MNSPSSSMNYSSNSNQNYSSQDGSNNQSSSWFGNSNDNSSGLWSQGPVVVLIDNPDKNILSTQALDIFRNKNKEGYVGIYDIRQQGYSGTYTAKFPSNNIQNAGNEARKYAFDAAKNSDAIVVISDASGPRFRLIFLDDSGSLDASEAKAFIEKIRNARNQNYNTNNYNQNNNYQNSNY